MLSKRAIYLLGLVTLFGFGGLGSGIVVYYLDRSIQSVFDHGFSVGYQVLTGAGYGVISAVVALRVITSGFFSPVRDFFTELFSGLNLKPVDVVFLSFCAGVGEEMLFRGGLQPLLGIWLTSGVFIILHGYINPVNWRMSVYGGVMILVSAGFGYLYEYAGMISAMTAHVVIDLILFFRFVSPVTANTR